VVVQKNNNINAVGHNADGYRRANHQTNTRTLRKRFINKNRHYTTQVVKLVTYVQQVSSSNLGRDNDYSDRGSSCLP